MTEDSVYFWAKTTQEGQPGISVRDHCLNVGCVAAALQDALPPAVKKLLPQGAVTLAALHDVGKISAGFLRKCPVWLVQRGLVEAERNEFWQGAEPDHSVVSQFCLQNLLKPQGAELWAVAAGAHHGRIHGRRIAQIRQAPARAALEEAARQRLVKELTEIFGLLPARKPEQDLSDLWLLAGLITVADWMGSNEAFFSPEKGVPPEESRRLAADTLTKLGWPGGAVRVTPFAEAFADGTPLRFQANSVQKAVTEAAATSRLIIVEAPMGCGKTEAALYAAQQVIARGQQHGLYFALPTQVTSNRIHQRVARFLKNTLAGTAKLRLAHANSWLEDNFDLRLQPAYSGLQPEDGDRASESTREARSWFASAKHALLAPYGVGTIDQALQGVVAVKHFFVRRFALAGKVVILDEIHSYDVYTGTLVTALIRELVNLQCSVIVLSATLTAAWRKELLKAANASEDGTAAESKNYPLVTAANPGRVAVSVAPEWTQHKRLALRAELISEEETIEALTSRAESGQHVLWVRNTVLEAQQAFRALLGQLRKGDLKLGLLHSRFPFQRRTELEQYWLERLGRCRPADGPGSIIIATQVVEQSVDIDLDFIVSDLAPTDMLLQRMGRLWRHERPTRAATQPDFWIRVPELDPACDARALKKALGRSAWVYAPYVLLRSATVFAGKTSLTLPDDIRPVLETTYNPPATKEPSGWQELHDELEAEKRLLTLNADAAMRVLANPALADEEGVLTRRKGPPTVPVLVLRSVVPARGNTWQTTALDGSSLTVSDYEWRMVSARFLNHWLVRVPKWMVPGDAPRPPWLTLHTTGRATVATVQDDGRLRFGEIISEASYNETLGVFAERRAKTTPQWNDDDEFDS